MESGKKHSGLLKIRAKSDQLFNALSRKTSNQPTNQPIDSFSSYSGPSLFPEQMGKQTWLALDRAFQRVRSLFSFLLVWFFSGSGQVLAEENIQFKALRKAYWKSVWGWRQRVRKRTGWRGGVHMQTHFQTRSIFSAQWFALQLRV